MNLMVFRTRSLSESLSVLEKTSCWTTVTGLTLWVAFNWLNARWVLGIFQLAALAVVSWVLCLSTKSTSQRVSLCSATACLLPLIGVLQLLTGTTSYLYATLLSTLDWATFASLVYLGSVLLRQRGRRTYFFQAIQWFGLAVAAMELCQILWLGRYAVLPRGLPLLSSNEYAELIELVLPLNLFLLVKRVSAGWAPVALSALMIATVVVSGARMGTIIVGGELVIFLVLSFRTIEGTKRLVNPISVTSVAAIALVLLGGAGFIRSRISEFAPFEYRLRLLTDTIRMIKTKPVTGVGLGCFSVVYPQFQTYDSVDFVNHVHNDYVEMISEGGLAWLAIWVLFFATCFRKGLLSSWGVGCLGILIHSITDFPLYRPEVAGMLAILLGGVSERGLTQTVKTPTLTELR